MILSILSTLYITWLCYNWGGFFLNLARFNRKNNTDSFFWNTIIGFCIILLISTVFSLFIPLGGISVQIALLIPAIVFNLKYPGFLKAIKSTLPDNKILKSLLASMLLLSLLMHSWVINHPDTLEYHQETIGWISRLKAIPGLAHLNHRLGYGGSWYIMCSLFSFHFADLKILTFINIVVPVWFMLFFVRKADENWNKKNLISISIIFVIILSFLVFSFLRLTLVSASPDFIASLFILLIFYYTLSGGKSLFFLSLLTATAIAIKLFTLPVLLISVLQSFRQIRKEPVRVLMNVLLLAILISPFIARNIITTGYAVFPHPNMQVTNSPYTLSAQEVQHEKDYIKAYNRYPVNYSNIEDVKNVAALPLNKWIPTWWDNKTIPDKAFLLICLASFSTLLILIKRILREKRYRLLYCIVTTICGVIFWLCYAPEIRLGGGYLLALPALVILAFSNNKIFTKNNPKAANVITSILILAISLYAIHRFLYYFDRDSLICPKGSSVQILYKEERLSKIPR